MKLTVLNVELQAMEWASAKNPELPILLPAKKETRKLDLTDQNFFEQQFKSWKL